MKPLIADDDILFRRLLQQTLRAGLCVVTTQGAKRGWGCIYSKHRITVSMCRPDNRSLDNFE